ncbi:MAG: cysteate synthase, partial [Halobacteriota archaeon]|nr:cysteate synthase [Halobacteriota archaeon]
GLWRFIDWLPVKNPSSSDSGPVTYRSEGLGRELGLSNLYITFSGYFPEKGGNIKTCSFKELEAVPTLQRAHERARGKILVIASAGNTSRGFSQISSSIDTPVITVVPSDYIDERMWTTIEPKKVTLVAVDGDYTDAIKVGTEIGHLDGMIPEGGVKNVARRDGMGVVMLDCVARMKRLPDHYFQAIGSGAGAIGSFEMAERTVRDGRFGDTLPRMHLAQNKPFTPISNAWNSGRDDIIAEEDMPDAEEAIEKIYASVLSTRNPPYAVKGGVYDILKRSNGSMYMVDNTEAKRAEKLFSDLEGIDLDPAACVAIGALIQATDSGGIGKDDYIMLNVTGGGYKRIEEDYNLHRIKPDFVVGPTTELEYIEGELRECLKQKTK